MQALGANVVRVHLQFDRFMGTPESPDSAALRRLAILIELTEGTGLRLDLTGLRCYHKADVPGWRDKLREGERSPKRLSSTSRADRAVRRTEAGKAHACGAA